MPDHRQVDVLICTFRRESVVDTLRSIAGQTLAREAFGVIVCDNDETPSARARVEGAARDLDLAVTYVHAPAQNISIARNACLATSSAPMMAFIDDDAAADPGWLQAYLDEMAASGADVLFGPVRAIYPPDAPAWAVKADLHATRPEVQADGTLKAGSTCNAMIRRSAVGEARFDLALGKSGGEDTFFFDRLRQKGAVLRYCAGATMTEIAPLPRLKMAWLLKRSFRSGQTHGRLLIDHGHARAPQIALAALKAVASLGQAAVNAASPAGWRRAVVRGALHVGVVARLWGVKEPTLYGADAEPNRR